MRFIVLLAVLTLMLGCAKKTPPSPSTTLPSPSTDSGKIKEQSPTEAEKAQQQSRDNLKDIGLGLHHYHDTNLAFPGNILDKNGKPLLSWRVAILPYIRIGEKSKVTYGKLYNQFKLNEAWDSPHNKKLLTEMPDYYRIASQSKDATETYYQRFQAANAAMLLDGERQPRFSDITDGTSNTLGVIEASPPVSWSQPIDISYDPKMPMKGLNEPYDDVYNFAMLDSLVYSVKSNMPDRIWQEIITRNQGEWFKRQELKDYIIPHTEIIDPEPATQLTADPIAKPKYAGSTAKLGQFMKALHSYYLQNGELPQNIIDKDGKPLLSWRVALLDSLVGKGLTDKFHLDEPWDSPHNMEMLSQMPEIYRNELQPEESTTTYIQRFVGPDTLYGKNQMSDFKLALIEVGPSVPWTQPVDLLYNPKKPLPEMKGPYDKICFFIAFNGMAKHVRLDIPEKIWRAIITDNPDESVKPTDMLWHLNQPYPK